MDDALAFTIEIDGASRGNPGPAAFGYVIRHQGEAVLEESGYLGRATNNVAEYLALIHALKKADELRGRDLTILSDSELLVRQMSGEYKVRNPQLAILHQQVSHLLPRFRQVRFTYVPREQNRDADRLCNEALNEAERNGFTTRD
jgi:ribonuclease HI